MAQVGAARTGWVAQERTTEVPVRLAVVHPDRQVEMAEQAQPRVCPALRSAPAPRRNHRARVLEPAMAAVAAGVVTAGGRDRSTEMPF